MREYVCVNGHDRCNTSYPDSDCPYCELKPSRLDNYRRRVAEQIASGKSKPNTELDRHLLG